MKKTRFETILTKMDRMSKIVSAAFDEIDELEDKIEMHRLRNALNDSRGKLLKFVFVARDAERIYSRKEGKNADD